MDFWFEFYDVHMNEKITCHNSHGFKWKNINIYSLLTFFCDPTPFLACWIVIAPIPSCSFVTSTHALCSCEKLGSSSLANRLHPCSFQLSMTPRKKSRNLKLNIAMAKSGGCIK
jgi:hypothetical protein